MSELWQPVVGFEGLYEVSDQGRVRSTPRPSTKGGILSPDAERGYKRVTLFKNGKRRRRRVHQLVMEAFAGPIPKGMHVAHGPNGIGDNSLSNLSFKTPSENNQDKYRDGTQQTGSRHPSAKLTEPIVQDIRRRYVKGNGAALAREYGVCKDNVLSIVHRRTWTHC